MKDGDTAWIVLCATQRSGSTMVCDDLTRAGMGKPEERFLGIVRAVQEKTLDRVASRVNGRLKDCANPDTHVASIKLMANYCKEINRALDAYYELETPSKNWSSIAKLFEGATFVMLHRGNHVDQAISRVVSRKTGVNHHVVNTDADFVPGNARTGLSDDHAAKLPISMQDIRVEVRRIAIENQMWATFFEHNDITPIHLHYEQASKSTNYLAAIAQSIGYELPTSISERNVQKLPNKRNKELAMNFIRTAHPEFFKDFS